jgi:hypothetical protein
MSSRLVQSDMFKNFWKDRPLSLGQAGSLGAYVVYNFCISYTVLVASLYYTIYKP